MANTAQAKKRARQAEQHRQLNVSQRTLVRTRIKNVVKALGGGDKTEAERACQIAVPIIDRMARKGLISKNKAARHKSRLSRRINKLGAESAASDTNSR